MPTSVTILLVGLNLALLYALLGMPLGIRTFRISRSIAAPAGYLWEAVYPLGKDAGWSGEVIACDPFREDPLQARMRLSWEGRDGAPIEHVVQMSDVAAPERFAMRIVDDTSLHSSFWREYREEVTLRDTGGATTVTFTRADRYRGAAFLIFRYFAARREIVRLKDWAETGRFRDYGIFEHPLTQVGFALVSALLFWPMFGLTKTGLALALILTSVVALHELGHMAAFRVAGHRKVRMIFIPLLGGIAIGGRPYDTRFEVGFVALMGAGFSAFLVPIAVETSEYAGTAGKPLAAMLVAIFAGCLALFNIANLVPVWKFDGGQVLRQIVGRPALQAVASFVLLILFLGVAHAAGFSRTALLIAGAAFALLSLITANSGARPRHDLKPLAVFERVALGAALLAVFAIHGWGLLWAAARFA